MPQVESIHQKPWKTIYKWFSKGCLKNKKGCHLIIQGQGMDTGPLKANIHIN